MIKTGMPNKEDKVLTFSNNQLIIETPEGAVKSFKLELDENNLPCVNPEYELLKPPQTRCLQCEGELSYDNIELFNGFCSAGCLNKYYCRMRHNKDEINKFEFVRNMSQVAYNIMLTDKIMHSDNKDMQGRIIEELRPKKYSEVSVLLYKIGNSCIRTAPPSIVSLAGIYDFSTPAHEKDETLKGETLDRYFGMISRLTRASGNRTRPWHYDKILNEVLGAEPKLGITEYLDAHEKYLNSLGIKEMVYKRQGYRPDTWRKLVTFWPLIELPYNQKHNFF